jgi:hypothetical protein
MRSALLVFLTVVALSLPAAASAKVQLLHVTSPVKRGAYASITVNTFTLATCSIRVRYGSRAPINAPGLYTKHSLFTGAVQWRWQMSPTATLGRWTIDVSCGAKGSLRTTFVVT